MSSSVFKKTEHNVIQFIECCAIKQDPAGLTNPIQHALWLRILLLVAAAHTHDQTETAVHVVARVAMDAQTGPGTTSY